MSLYAQCMNAGMRFCADCRRNVDNNPPESRTAHQAYVTPTNTQRCAHWLSMPARHKPQARDAT